MNSAPYSYPADIWSFGCVLYELANLVPTHPTPACNPPPCTPSPPPTPFSLSSAASAAHLGLRSGPAFPRCRSTSRPGRPAAQAAAIPCRRPGAHARSQALLRFILRRAGPGPS